MQDPSSSELEGIGKWCKAFPKLQQLLTGSELVDDDAQALLALDPTTYAGDDEVGQSLKRLYRTKVQPQSYANAVESLKVPMDILEASTLEGLVEFTMSRMPGKLEEWTAKQWHGTRIITDELLNEVERKLAACGLEDVAAKARLMHRFSEWLRARFRLAAEWQAWVASPLSEIPAHFAKALASFKTEHGIMMDWCTVHADRWPVLRMGQQMCLTKEFNEDLLSSIKADGDECLKLFIENVQDRFTKWETTITNLSPSLAILNNGKLLIDEGLQAVVLQGDRREVSSTKWVVCC
jgi:hypothetical protein